MIRSIQPLRYFLPLVPYPRIIYHDIKTDRHTYPTFETRIPVKSLTGEYLKGHYLHSTDQVTPGDDMSAVGFATRSAFWLTALAAAPYDLEIFMASLATCDVVYCGSQRLMARDEQSRIIF